MTEMVECDQNIIKSKLPSFLPALFFSPQQSLLSSPVSGVEKSLAISTNSTSAQGRDKPQEHKGVRTEIFSSWAPSPKR